MAYPVAISSEAAIAARIECRGPRWVRKAASGLCIERASMSRLTLDMIKISWRFGSNCKACPAMKPKSACESASIGGSPFCNGFVEESVYFCLVLYRAKRGKCLAVC